jgi:hypothetical protein
MCHVISDHKTRVVKTSHELKNFCKTQKVFKAQSQLDHLDSPEESAAGKQYC